MRNLYRSSDAQQIIERLAHLKSDSPRQWGSMSASQAVAHCAKSLDWAVGDRVPPRMFFAGILGRIIKPMVLGDDAPFRRDSPTAKDLIIHGQPDLPTERKRLLDLIDRFIAAGPTGCTTNPHSFFGRLTPDEWAILMYKHLDHHLRQFGV